jgi:hypothetical protein
MKSHTEYLMFETRERREMVHITDQVEQIVRRSGVKDGLCFVSTKRSYYVRNSLRKTRYAQCANDIGCATSAPRRMDLPGLVRKLEQS